MSNIEEKETTHQDESCNTQGEMNVACEEGQPQQAPQSSTPEEVKRTRNLRARCRAPSSFKKNKPAVAASVIGSIEPDTQNLVRKNETTINSVVSENPIAVGDNETQQPIMSEEVKEPQTPPPSHKFEEVSTTKPTSVVYFTPSTVKQDQQRSREERFNSRRERNQTQPSYRKEEKAISFWDKVKSAIVGLFSSKESKNESFNSTEHRPQRKHQRPRNFNQKGRGRRPQNRA